MPLTCLPDPLSTRGQARSQVGSAHGQEKDCGSVRRGARISPSRPRPRPPNRSEVWISRRPIYSREINYWLWEVAVDLLKNRPDFGCLYVHTTDYPMHTWPAVGTRVEGAPRPARRLLGRAVAAAPDAAFLITADHGMNAKSRCWDLAKACKNRGLELRFALSAERDKYVKHHRTFGGTGYVWLRSPGDAEARRNPSRSRESRPSSPERRPRDVFT